MVSFLFIHFFREIDFTDKKKKFFFFSKYFYYLSTEFVYILQFGDNNHLNLVILGNADLTGTLERQVKALCNTEDEFMHQDEVFSLDYRCVSGDVSLPENAFRTQDFLPHGKFSLLDNVHS